jgi:hypothetical protein
MATSKKKIEQMASRVSSWRRNVHLKEFTIFSRLPIEFRLRVWMWVSRHPRLIELEYSQPHNYNLGLAERHGLLRVSKITRAPPALLSACREARGEGKRLYEDFLVRFDMIDGRGNVVYYNPEVDIVYFGRKTCVSSIAAFLRKDIEIQRVAIEGQLSQPYDRCCTWEASDTLGVQRGEGAIGGITGLQALHGYDPDVLEGNTSWPGCKGLKDLFIIMDRWIWRDETQSIGLSSKLYDASTHQQREWKVNVTRELARIESDNGGLGSVGQNKWTGACKPTIQMMSLYPFAHCGKKTMTFNADRTDPYIKDMARSIYCAAWDTSTADVSVEVEFDQRYPTDRATCWELGSLDEYEITIHGSPDQIERAEELIEAGIVNILVPYMEIRE